jgi:hypothetical protein
MLRLPCQHYFSSPSTGAILPDVWALDRAAQLVVLLSASWEGTLRASPWLWPSRAPFLLAETRVIPGVLMANLDMRCK